MRNAKIIEDAFEQIREQSGSATMNIEEIVTTFIKAEEQNRSLQTYVNNLNQESDVLEERHRQLDSNINSFQNLVKMSEAEKQNKLQNMRARADTLRNEIMRAN